MRILYSTNPLNPAGDGEEFFVPNDLSPNEIIKHLGWKLTRPTILLVDGEPWGRTRWDDSIPVGAHVAFVECPRGTVAFLVVMLVVAVGAYIYASSSASSNASTENYNEMGTPDTIYSFTSGNNRLRLGEPFVEHFGRFKAFPDLVQQSYIKNIDNDQYMYFLGIIGVGEYEIEGVYIDNTPLTDYEDSSYNIISPGDSLTLIQDIVWTCNEVSNQELETDWINYIVSAPLTEILFVEYDVTFAQGLISYNQQGNPGNMSVTVETQVRLVDDAGQPTSDSVWTTLDTQTWTGASKDPLRYSRKIAVPEGGGRYQFRARRTSTASGSSRIMDKAVLTGLRGYGAPHPDYGDVTLIEAKIKATDQLNGNASSQINVVATRKLYEVTGTGFGSILTATRSIVDAVAYMVTATNGGQQPDSLLDFEALDALRDTYAAADHYFDYRFKTKMSVMDAAAKAATCSMSIPCMPSGLFALIRDEVKIVPSCVFTNDNITDLKVVVNPRTPDSYTCVNIRYTDPDTWDEEVVTCYDEDGSDDNPSEITLDGCTSRQQAYEIGMFVYLQDKLERGSVNFVTDLSGYIPTLLSKILVPNKMTDWGASGLVMAVDGTNIWLSDPVDFNNASQGFLYVVLEDGTAGGPYVVTPTGSSHCVEGTIAVLKNLEEDGVKASRWIFGIADTEPLFVRVGSIVPQGRDQIKISGSVIDDNIYEDPGTAPEIGDVGGTPALLSGFSLIHAGDDSSDDHEFLLTWAGSAISIRIEIDEGSGYVQLEDEYTFHNYEFTTSADEIDVKVTPYNDSGIQTGEAEEQTYTILTAPTGLASTQDEDGIDADWNVYTDALSYYVSIEAGGEEITHDTVSTNSIELSWHDIELLGGPWPSFTIRLWALLAGGRQSEEASLSVNVTALSSPSQVDFQARLANGISLSWSEVAGAKSYVVCHSDSPDSSGEFTPSASNVVYQGEQPAAQIGGLNMTGDYTHSFKVAAQQYGHDIADLNFTAALEVTPATDDVSVHSVNLASGNNQDYTGPNGGSNYTYQLIGTASGDNETVIATLTGGGSGSAYCAGEGDSDGGDTTASLVAMSSGSSDTCNVAISGGGSFSGSLIITKIS